MLIKLDVNHVQSVPTRVMESYVKNVQMELTQRALVLLLVSHVVVVVKYLITQSVSSVYLVTSQLLHLLVNNAKEIQSPRLLEPAHAMHVPMVIKLMPLLIQLVIYVNLVNTHLVVQHVKTVR